MGRKANGVQCSGNIAITEMARRLAAGVAGMSDEDLPPTLNQLFLERLLMPAKEM